LPEKTPKAIFDGNSRNKLKVQGNSANKGKISSSVSFHQSFKEFHVNFKTDLFSTFDVVKNYFL